MPYLTLRTNIPFAGFVNNQLKVQCEFAESLDVVIKKLNNFRSPENQIKELYTFNMKKIPNNFWNSFSIKEDYILFVNMG